MRQDKMNQLAAWLAAADGYVSGEELAAVLHTTTRTVRNYIFEINASSEGEPLILASRKGYRWNIPEESFPALSRKRSVPKTPVERHSYIIRHLLHQNHARYDDFLEKLMVSTYTLDGDLATVKEMLRPFQMLLHRKGDRLYLEGRQMDRRRLIVNTIFRSSGIQTLSLEYLNMVFPGISAVKVSEILLETLPAYGLVGIGEKYYELVLHVTVQIDQIKAGNLITEREYDLEELEGYPDYLCALEISEKLRQLMGITYSRREKEYLALLLIAMTEDSTALSHGIPSAAARLRQPAGTLVTRLGRYLRTDFSQDTFTTWISMYLQRMIVRQQLRLSRPSQMRGKMRTAYPTLYELTGNFILGFSRMVSVPIRSDEVCWLSIILASYIQDKYVFEAPVNCTLLMPTALHLAEKTRQSLVVRTEGILKIHQLLTLTDESQIRSDSKLVLSLIPLRHHPHWVQISAFPKSADYQRIYREIRNIKMEGYIDRLLAYLKRYASDAHYLYTAEIKNQSTLIHNVCSRLQHEGIVSSQYEERLNDTENFETSGIDNLVAVPFVSHPCVSRNSVFIVSSEKPISWGSGKIGLFFFLVCRDADNMDFRDLYDLLIKIFCHPKNVSAVSESKSLQKLYENLEQIRKQL